MSTEQPYTDAELEAGAKALDEYRHFIASDGYPAIRVGSHEAEAQVVLGAVLPLHAARIRQEIAETIDALREVAEGMGVTGSTLDAYRGAADAARSYTTAPTEGDQDAQPVE